MNTAFLVLQSCPFPRFVPSCVTKMSHIHHCQLANWALHRCFSFHRSEEASAHHCGKYCISTGLGPIGVKVGRVHLWSLEHSGNHGSLCHVQLGGVPSVVVLRSILNPYSTLPKVRRVGGMGQ